MATSISTAVMQVGGYYDAATYNYEWPFSNGYKWTDSYGNYIDTGIYCDGLGEIYEPIANDEVTGCQTCNKEGVPLSQRTYPCMFGASYRANGRLAGTGARLYGYFPDDDMVSLANNVVCQLRIKACDTCISRADAIMKTSDHLVSAFYQGDDWWELIDALSLRLTSNKWKDRANNNTYISEAKAASAETIQTISCAMVTSNPTKAGRFADMPMDVFKCLGKHIHDNSKEHAYIKAAIRIQSIYRGWRQRFYSAKKDWHSQATRHTFDEARQANLTAKCDDCGMRRSTRNMVMFQASADDQDYSAVKYVCRSYCSYECPDCGEYLAVRQDDKSNTGEETFFECYCGTTFKLNELWWGMSIADYIARYG